MRTTLTLDDDVVALVREVVARKRTSFKQVVNEALRAGLATQRSEKPRRVRTRTYDGGAMLIDITSVSQALAVAEGDVGR